MCLHIQCLYVSIFCMYVCIYIYIYRTSCRGLSTNIAGVHPATWGFDDLGDLLRDCREDGVMENGPIVLNVAIICFICKYL